MSEPDLSKPDYYMTPETIKRTRERVAKDLGQLKGFCRKNKEESFRILRDIYDWIEEDDCMSSLDEVTLHMAAAIGLHTALLEVCEEENTPPQENSHATS